MEDHNNDANFECIPCDEDEWLPGNGEVTTDPCFYTVSYTIYSRRQRKLMKLGTDTNAAKAVQGCFLEKSTPKTTRKSVMEQSNKRLLPILVFTPYLTRSTLAGREI